MNAIVGYASSTTDAGQPWFQDGSFTFLSDGKVNREAFCDFSERSIVEQANKARALVNLHCGRAPRDASFDGHSQGGRQGMKIAQEHPELYDVYLIAQPVLNIPRFGTVGLYPQLVMKYQDVTREGIINSGIAQRPGDVHLFDGKCVALFDEYWRSLSS